MLKEPSLWGLVWEYIIESIYSYIPSANNDIWFSLRPMAWLISRSWLLSQCQVWVTSHVPDLRLKNVHYSHNICATHKYILQAGHSICSWVILNTKLFLLYHTGTFQYHEYPSVGVEILVRHQFTSPFFFTFYNLIHGVLLSGCRESQMTLIIACDIWGRLWDSFGFQLNKARKNRYPFLFLFLVEMFWDFLFHMLLDVGVLCILLIMLKPCLSSSEFLSWRECWIL